MPGYGLPAHKKGLLPWKWAEDRLKRSHNYWIATARPDGSPHLMLVWGIWADQAFYFSTGKESRKYRNLKANSHCVIGTEQADHAVIVEGKASELTDPSLLKRLSRLYEKKYPPYNLDPSPGPVFAVRPHVVFALDEKKTLNSATRWKFES
jgi:nitroimidazol reductase NimA-like FMN-containing flavoprotein (pyridoxamine 5'-phosphate oxidase superfamily)